MATITISYDEHNNVIRHLIEAMLAAGAKIEKCSSNAKLQMSSVDRSLAEFERGETTDCDTFVDFQKSIEA